MIMLGLRVSMSRSKRGTERERERERQTERGGRGCDVSDEQWGVLRGDVERLGQLSS